MSTHGPLLGYCLHRAITRNGSHKAFTRSCHTWAITRYCPHRAITRVQSHKAITRLQLTMAFTVYSLWPMGGFIGHVLLDGRVGVQCRCSLPHSHGTQVVVETRAGLMGLSWYNVQCSTALYSSGVQLARGGRVGLAFLSLSGRSVQY